MSSPLEPHEQLNNWKSGSTKLFMYSAISGLTCLCVGFLRHVSPTGLHFGIDDVDDKNFNFSVNLNRARLSFVDAKEDLPFPAPRRRAGEFGTVLLVELLGEERPEVIGMVFFAEVFPSKFIEI